MRCFLLFLLFLGYQNVFGAATLPNLYETSYLLNTDKNITSLEAATHFYHQKKHLTRLQKNSFQNFRKKEYTWILIRFPKSNEPQYITVGNALFDKINLYNIDTKSEISNLRTELNLRHPAWKIPPSVSTQNLLLRLKEKNAGFKTYLNLKSRSINRFVTASQTEYTLFGCLLFSISLLMIVTFYISYQKRNWGVFWFGINLIFVIVRIATATGITSQIGIDKIHILTYNVHALAPNISVFSMLMFYYLFYNYPQKAFFLKKALKILILINAIVLIINIANVFILNKLNTEVLTQSNIFICIAVCLSIHLYLMYLKAIPYYILIAFLLPPIFVIINANTMRPLDLSLFWQYFLMTMVYLAKLAECLLIILYIINSSFKKELLLKQTEKENVELRLKITNEIGEIEKKNRNKLLADVHDTFGSYIVSLQLSLQNKQTNQATILQSFNNEYRMLLNNLYHPSIYQNNLIEHIETYATKINELSNCSVIFNNNFKNNHAISKLQANEIYKIIIELVINAVKHSKATQIAIQLENNQSFTFIEVKDNGIGFILKNEKLITTFGLKSVQERITYLNGHFKIDSKINIGTEIYIKFPNCNLI